MGDIPIIRWKNEYCFIDLFLEIIAVYEVKLTFNSLLMNKGKWIIKNRKVGVMQKKRSRWIKLRTHWIAHLHLLLRFDEIMIASLKLSLLLISRNNEVGIIRKGRGQKKISPIDWYNQCASLFLEFDENILNIFDITIALFERVYRDLIFR